MRATPPSEQGSKAAERARAIVGHAVAVAVSFILSFAIVTKLPILQGEAIDALFIGLIVVHLFALGVGCCIPKLTRTSGFVVFAIAFSFGGCAGAGRIKDLLYLRYRAPYDRFRDCLADPIPESVTSLRFVPLIEQIRPELTFWFDIHPSDLDAILKELKMERVDPKSMRNPKDFFQHPYYLPVRGDYEIYQGVDCFDNVLTIKTNAPHTHAIFRKESSSVYRDRNWERGNPTIIRMDDEALERMRREYGADR